MKATIPSGKYVIAVSGGVDSMVLLDLLQGRPGVELIVAHFDHGIRKDSAEDRKLVAAVAEAYGLPFIYKEGKLGAGASEAQAREVRYVFLRQVQHEHGAQGIITAHHEDDVLETAILNVMRGTGRKGLTSLQHTKDVLRPLLHATKSDILAYADAHRIQWREDSTNADTRYLRNYVRLTIMPKLTSAQRTAFTQSLQHMRELNHEIDDVLLPDLGVRLDARQLDRRWFIMLPHAVSLEVMAGWLRHHAVRDFDKPLLQRLVVSAKTLPAGKRVDVNAQYLLEMSKTQLTMTDR